MESKVFLQVVESRISDVDSVEERDEIKEHGRWDYVEVEFAD